jgi:hypothetical protein
MTSLTHHQLVHHSTLDHQYVMHMQQLRNDWHGINASNPGSIRVFHSSPDGNCFFNTLCRHMTGSESHHLLLKLHIVIELLLNIDYYMNFSNGCISQYAGYVNVHSTANGAWRFRNLLCEATTNCGYVPGYLAAPASVLLGRNVALHCPLRIADYIEDANFTALYNLSNHATLHMAWELFNYSGSGVVSALNHFVGIASCTHRNVKQQSVYPQFCGGINI